MFSTIKKVPYYQTPNQQHGQLLLPRVHYMSTCRYCASEVATRELTIHETDCRFRKYDCDCGDKVLLSQLVHHKRNDCLIASVDCPLFESHQCGPNCNGLVRRCDLNEHIASQQRLNASTSKRQRSEEYECQKLPCDVDIALNECRERSTHKKSRTDYYAPIINQASVNETIQLQPTLVTADIRPTIVEDDDCSSVISSLTSNSMPPPTTPSPTTAAGRSNEVIDLTDSVVDDTGEEHQKSGQDDAIESNANRVVVQQDKYTRYTGEVNILGLKHGRGRLEFTNGNLYEGEFQNDQRHGQGTLQQVSKLCMVDGLVAAGTYRGEWRDDFKHGRGVYRFSSGDVYEGNYHCGRINGDGKMVYADGSTYEGKWRSNRWSGRGVSTDVSGVQTEGVWKDGELVVQSTTRAVNEKSNEVVIETQHSKYIGEVNRDGLKHGRGRLEYASGNMYEGEFRNDKRHGQGVFTSVIDAITNCTTTKGTYTGEWSNDLKHGEGTFVGANGDVYTGNYRGGGINGHGRMVYANGSVFDGKWHYGHWNGRGEHTSANGERTAGIWRQGKWVSDSQVVEEKERVETKGQRDDLVVIETAHSKYTGQVNIDGLKHGRGRLEYVSGNLYEGEFQNDQRHGQGTLQQVHKVGTKTGLMCGGTYTGQWLADKKHGQGTFIHTDGETYEGEFQAGQRDGHGCVTYSDGTTREGLWRKGKLTKSVPSVKTWVNNPFQSTHKQDDLILHLPSTHQNHHKFKDGGANEREGSSQDYEGDTEASSSDEEDGDDEDSQDTAITGLTSATERLTHNESVIDLTGSVHDDDNTTEGGGKDVVIRERQSTYTGQVNSQGQKHGKGKVVYANGNSYEGQFANDKRNGMGVSTHNNQQCGGKYTGHWVDDRKQGQGRMECSNGDVYEGSFMTGSYHGSGEMVYASGATYEGSWSMGKWNGQGVHTTAAGKKTKGNWKNNKKL